MSLIQIGSRCVGACERVLFQSKDYCLVLVRPGAISKVGVNEQSRICEQSGTSGRGLFVPVRQKRLLARQAQCRWRLQESESDGSALDEGW